MLHDIEKDVRREFQEVHVFSAVFLKWLCISVVIGLAGGLIGSAFYLSVAKATAVKTANPWLVYLLPLGGVAIAAAYHFTKTEGEGTNDIIDSILLGRNVHLVLLPVIFVSTVVTHLLGGSAGREGAALQIGGSLGCTIGKAAKLDEKEERIAVLSGMAAVF